MTQAVRIDHVLIGQPRPFGPNGEPSGIDKRPVDRPVRVEPTGLVGDGQGDTKRHGGPEKAVHHYPRDHYASWRRDHPGFSVSLENPAAFGENLSTLGLTEEVVCVGDIYRLGTALVQVAQGRQPCWRLNVRFGDPKMALRVQQTGRAGWYYRVLEPGEVAPGATLALVERPQPAWPLSRLLHVLYRDTLNRAALAGIAEIPQLAESWRKLARRRLERGDVEDWDARVRTPTDRSFVAGN
ncbi:MOSC domain-containing protein [Rhodovibrio sodomensis]|uniref:MOSC domain-containing protein n=1 Tax=Rhodovibrio sodomensis TaxID=1088 RepID=A0ABS1DHV5_9PROT|nr:MOSC domain-containing protein [Rhodovibrio sodomensis]MBK1669794.1 MOSC domain-containing protein [Rhodovibrio sodomensis]